MPATRPELVTGLMKARIMAILRGLAPGQVSGVVDALIRGGITAMEVTMNSPGALEQIRIAVEAAGGRALVGAGTVLDAAAATEAILAGAEFLVAPNLDERVIRTAHRYGKAAIPGAMTPNEIAAAAEAGADIVKVFPAGTLSPRYFREVRAPLGHIPLMATGGVSLENAREFLKAGAVMLGVGGSLVNHELIAAGRWEEIATRAAELTAAASS